VARLARLFGVRIAQGQGRRRSNVQIRVAAEHITQRTECTRARVRRGQAHQIAERRNTGFVLGMPQVAQGRFERPRQRANAEHRRRA